MIIYLTCPLSWTSTFFIVNSSYSSISLPFNQGSWLAICQWCHLFMCTCSTNSGLKNVKTKCQELSIVWVWRDISSATLVIVCRNVRAPQVGFTLSVTTTASEEWRRDQFITVRPMAWPLEWVIKRLIPLFLSCTQPVTPYQFSFLFLSGGCG